MAIPHYSVTTVSRGSVRRGKIRPPKGGGSAALIAAYIERGGTHISRADDVLFKGTSGPKLGDWTVVDRWERRKDAVVARHIVAAIPYCLPLIEQIRIAQEHADFLRKVYGAAVKWALHRGTGYDGHNVHIHFVLTTRAVDEQSTPSKKKLQNTTAIEAASNRFRNAVLPTKIA